MTGSAFLDKGVLLGYCFTVETHHVKCRNYLEEEDLDFYVTEKVDAIFDKKKEDLTDRYSAGILDHVAELTKKGYQGEIGPQELKRIRQNIQYENDSRRFLEHWYINEAPSIISAYELKSRLRDLARDIDKIAVDRKNEFDELVDVWERDNDHEDIHDGLTEIRDDKEEDFWICISAHDLANNLDGHTELATTDLSDLGNDGRKQLICDITALDDVVPLAETGY